jgi:ATP-dependent helicase HrpB
MTIEQYPVLEILPRLKERLAAAPIVILQAPPGAGKSTILPLKLMSEAWLGNKKIVMLEPRRLAAKAVAERMANLLDESAGERVGYRVRFDTKVSVNTKVEVVTEGILTRMIQSDNSLEEIGLLIFDEFHERSLHADLALALSLQVQQVLRADLRILIMSATLDGDALSSILGNAPIIVSKGRQFPVNQKFSSQDSDQPIAIKVAQTIKKAIAEEQGDILVFLPGSGEIKRVQQILEEGDINAVISPLFGDLTFAKQQEAILPRRDGRRKIILATSIAETSLTIEGIKVVVDSGLSRVPRFDPRSGLTRLETIRVTKDAADQRAGRAGRLGPGVCYRLWTQGIHLSLAEQRKPEILEADLAPLMLELAQWGIKNVNELTWVTQPPTGAVKQSMELLNNLEAVDKNGITSRGKEMLQLPTHPRIAHMMLVAKEDSPLAISVATDLAALLEERDPLDREAGADVTLRIEALRKWRSREKFYADRSALERIEKLAANWRRIMRVSLANEIPSDAMVGKLLWAAYPERLAQQQGKHNSRYKLLTGRMVSLAQHDPLVRESWICAAQLDAGTNEGKVFMAAPVHLSDLMDHATEELVVKWDNERSMIVSLKEKRLGPLLLESKPHAGSISETERIRVISGKVRETELRIFGDIDTRAAFQSRVLSLKHWRPEEAWPSITDQYLMEHIEEWLGPFLPGISRESELLKLDAKEILKNIVPWDLRQKIDILAPEKIQVPSGSMITLQYFKEGDPPVLEVRLQEVFGLTDTPTVNEGRIKIKLNLLSPGFKPVQVTQDLKSFWQTTYHQVRKELRMRYPRHHWPEDPWTAEAVRGARKKFNN